MLTSTRRSLAYPNPNRSDTADVPRDIGVIIAALELDVVFGQGTHAARPAAGSGNPAGTGGGRLYWETDTSGLFYDTGSAWVGPINTSAIGPGTITQSMLAKPSVGAPEIIDGSVGSAELASGAVTAAKIAAALFPSQGAGASTEALRALGTAAGNALAGNDPRLASYGTSFPGSPSDGQEHVLTDSVTNPTWSARFRFNNGSLTGNKWECIGPATIDSFVAAPSSPGGTGSYGAITGGPSVTPPRAGLYDVVISADLTVVRGGTFYAVSPTGAGLTAADSAAIYIDQVASGDNSSVNVTPSIGLHQRKVLKRKALSVSAVTLQGKFNNNGGSNGSRFIANASIELIPIQLS